MLTEEMLKELQTLEKKNRGNLQTEAVVEFARNPTTALHAHPAFAGWNDKDVAHKYYLVAARSIIRVYVTIIKDGSEEKMMRGYVNIHKTGDVPVYQATKKVLLENRNAIINMVCDRLLSIIKSYPLSEFDSVVQTIMEIQESAQGGDQKAA